MKYFIISIPFILFLFAGILAQLGLMWVALSLFLIGGIFGIVLTESGRYKL